jgi:hypothetical protein
MIKLNMVCRQYYTKIREKDIPDLVIIKPHTRVKSGHRINKKYIDSFKPFDYPIKTYEVNNMTQININADRMGSNVFYTRCKIKSIMNLHKGRNVIDCISFTGTSTSVFEGCEFNDVEHITEITLEIGCCETQLEIKKKDNTPYILLDNSYIPNGILYYHDVKMIIDCDNECSLEYSAICGTFYYNHMNCHYADVLDIRINDSTCLRINGGLGMFYENNEFEL